MYVPAKMGPLADILVDVGTGYYVKKGAEASIKFFEKKASFLAENATKLQDIIEEKQRSLSAVSDVIRMKVEEEAKKAR